MISCKTRCFIISWCLMISLMLQEERISRFAAGSLQRPGEAQATAVTDSIHAFFIFINACSMMKKGARCPLHHLLYRAATVWCSTVHVNFHWHVLHCAIDMWDSRNGRYGADEMDVSVQKLVPVAHELTCLPRTPVTSIFFGEPSKTKALFNQNKGR